MRVVLDTNVFISALIVPRRSADRAFQLARQRRFQLCTSVPILTETANKLREKFEQPDEDIKLALKIISRAGEIVRPRPGLNVLEDEPDNRILECALEARADLVVSGDRHLLSLKKFEGIPIVRLVDLLRMSRRRGQQPRRRATRST